MGKKRKQKQYYSHKMSFWSKILKSNRHAASLNNQTKKEIARPESVLRPSSKALIYSSELEYIARCIQDYPNIETGGQLYGAWTASGAPRVIYALGPGPRANHQTTFFNQDVEYLESIGGKLKEFGLQHIGEWHSHHSLGLPHPSVHDVQTMQNGIVQLNLNRLILCIGSISDNKIAINPFNFAKDSKYISAYWEVINTHNRLRDIIDSDLKDFLRHPHSTNFTFAESNLTNHSSTINNQAGWFSTIENRRDFKKIIDLLKSQSWVKEVSPKMSETGLITLKVLSKNFVEIIEFPKDFPYKPFVIDHMGFVEQTYKHFVFKDSWEYTIGVFETFKLNYNNHLKKIANG